MTVTLPLATSKRPSGPTWISWKASGRTTTRRIGLAASRSSVLIFAISSGVP
jgi:hypothetical protein